MVYYNRKLEKIDLSSMKYMTSGGCASIYHNNDIVFKRYYHNTSYSMRLNSDMFDLLKQIDNPHFIKLIDIYSKMNYLVLLKNRISLSNFKVDGYTAKYYTDNTVDVLYENVNYILENFCELEKLFKLFSDNKIVATDVRRDNVIIGKKDIIIIDPDLFYITNTVNSQIELKNKTKLLKLFRSILVDAVSNFPLYGKYIKYIDEELCNIEIKENTDVTYEISKKLNYVKKPIELFKDKLMLK